MHRHKYKNNSLPSRHLFVSALYSYSWSQGHISDPWEPDTPALSKILISLSHNTTSTVLLLPSLRARRGAGGAREAWKWREIFFSPPTHLMTVPAGLSWTIMLVGKKASCQLISPFLSFSWWRAHLCRLRALQTSGHIGRNTNLPAAKQHWRALTEHKIAF